MPKVALYNMRGEQIGDVELNNDVFGIEPNEAVVYEFVKMQLANKRVGNACTKTRAEVSGGGKKPWRQKGTGRARVGSSRNPIWRHGGIVFGPKPRSFAYTMPKKVRRLAMKSVLSDKVLQNSIIVVDKFEIDAPKTKTMVEALKALNVTGKTMIVTGGTDMNVYKSARNIEGINPVKADFISVYDIINSRTLVLTQDAVARIEEVFA